ncbi:Zf-FLZ domain [Sesbania bispinosa]|nr:Zf-FLZ domain [Sesbania bispinosa]
MLRKRTRSIQKDQHHMGQMAISILMMTTLLSLLLWRAMSPTSPLDVTLLSNLGNPFRTPRSSTDEGQQRSWDSSKVSKSLPEEFCKLPYTQNGSIFHKGESTVLFEIGETLLEHDLSEKTKDLSGLTVSMFDADSESFALNQVSSPPHFIGGSHHQNPITLPPAELNSNPVSLSSSNEFVKSLSASEIELSEDYTCVISHGPNPKTTHIFCDCILEIEGNDLKKHDEIEEKEEEGEGLFSPVVNKLQTPHQYPSGYFLSFCYHCSKKFEEGKDIYMYRGEKAFCSLDCRALEIKIDEELEKSNLSSENSLELESVEDLSETGILPAT